MKLPHPAAVRRQAAHPSEDQIGVEQRERKAFAQNGRDLLAGEFQIRPTAGFIEPGDQEVRGLFSNRFGLTVEIDDAHARGSLHLYVVRTLRSASLAGQKGLHYMMQLKRVYANRINRTSEAIARTMPASS